MQETIHSVGRFMFGVGGLIQYRDSNEILVLRRAAEHSDFNQDKWVSPEEALSLIIVKGIQDDVRSFIQYRNELRCTMSTIDGNWQSL
jgi:hypothetical protein